jgi:large subunit ribosomal protein L22
VVSGTARGHVRKLSIVSGARNGPRREQVGSMRVGTTGCHEAQIMVSKATIRFTRLSPRKARVIVNLVRGRQAGEALQLLEFTRKAAAPVVKKLIESAVANAKTQSPSVDVDSLFIETAFVDKAPNKHMRRWRPRAMGRATRVQKGLSHITIVLGER